MVTIPVTLVGAHDLPRVFVRCGYPLYHLLCGLMGRLPLEVSGS